MRLAFSVVVIVGTVYFGSLFLYRAGLTGVRAETVPLSLSHPTIDTTQAAVAETPVPTLDYFGSAVGRREAPGATHAALPLPRSATVRHVIYRWRDANGTLHLTSDAPPSGVDAEVIAYAKPKVQTVADGQRTPRSSKALIDSAARPDHASPSWLPETMDELLEQVGDTLGQLQRRNQYLETLKKDL